MKALITGASSGIGRDIALYLSEKGYDLILVATNEKRLKETAKLCKSITKIILCDLSKEKEVFNLYDKVKPENIDLLVNNAGFGLFGFFDQTDLRRELK